MTSTLLVSRMQSTCRIYNTTWKAFVRWARRKSIDLLKPRVKSILTFLQEGHDRGLKASTLRCQTAACSTVLPLFQGWSTSRYTHNWQFLREVSLIEPLLSHRFPVWGLNTVLAALTRSLFEPIQDIHLKWLPVKALFLTAVTSVRGVSKLGELSVNPNLLVFH